MTRNVNIGEMPILQTRDSQQMIDEIVEMLSQGRQPLQQIAEPNRPAPTQERSSLDRYLSEDAVRQQKLDRAAGAFAGQNRENAQRQRQRVSQFFSNLF